MDIMEQARTEGYAANSVTECPYISGQRVLSAWYAGFIRKCVETGVTPADTPPYLLGRIAYLTGFRVKDLPDG